MFKRNNEKGIYNLKVALNETKAMVETGKIASYDEYLGFRKQINGILVQMLLGCEARENRKGEVKFSYNKPLPTASELSKIVSTMDEYILSTEAPFLVNLGEGDEDDMMIEECNLELNMKKINNKNVSGMIPSITNVFLSTAELVEVAALGTELRKHNNKVTAFVVGGIVVTVVAAAGIGYAVHKRKEEQAYELMEDDNVIEIECHEDDDCVDDVEVVELDIDEAV